MDADITTSTSARAVRFHDHNYAPSEPSRPRRGSKSIMSASTAEIVRGISSASNSSGESDIEQSLASRRDSEVEDEFTPPIVSTPLNDPNLPWPGTRTQRPSIATNGLDGLPPTTPSTARAARPAAIRTPSNAYNPARRPNQFPLKGSHRNSSTNRARRNPNAEYRAQEKAYVQRLRQDAPDDDFFNPDPRTPSLDYSTGSETDEESPSTADYIENDPYDQETLLYYGNDDLEPSVEELKIPANRERLQWHSMLANVLTGDVVKQEKKRLIGSGDEEGDANRNAEIWIGVRAKICGRTLQAQRRVVEDGREKAKIMIEDIITFEVVGEAEAGKSAAEQVKDVVAKIDKVEALYPTRQAMETAHPRTASLEFKGACDAVIAWHNTTELINTELMILRYWVGNDELEFSRPRTASANDANLLDDSSFVDRVLKEDGLKTLMHDRSLLAGLHEVIKKAKDTFIANAQAFAQRHLPPFIEELLTLINFPSRLVQEIIRMRLSYAKKMKDASQQGVMMTEQMISQFKILLNIATKIKSDYSFLIQSQAGWEPPPCLEEGFDNAVLDSLKFYFKMLNWKLSANKNTFKEAEILEQEWEFSNKLGRHLEGGDVEVAEQFSALTSRSLLRLTSHFEKELQRPAGTFSSTELEKKYKQILDSVRVRQRKLFRFFRILTQRFENSTEYNINLEHRQMSDLIEELVASGHMLMENTAQIDDLGTYILASPALHDRPKDIQSLLTTCYHAEENPVDISNPYVLILKPENPLVWTGARLSTDVRQPYLDVKPGRLRVVADGSQQRLASANLSFTQAINMDLTKLIEQRANLPRVDQELRKIKKTASKLSNTIMDSVEIVRKQTEGMQCQELIQACFAFATEFGQRSVLYLDHNRRALNNIKLTRLALDWVSFICDDCVASDRRTFRWAVVALEFAMIMTRGQNILSISESEYAKLRSKVAGCMSLLISHFDIMGARSTMAAQQEKQRMESGKMKLDIRNLKDDDESARLVREQWVEQLEEIDNFRKQKESERQALGRVLEDSNDADRALTYLSSSATNVTLRWQQGQFVGGGTFGSVYAAINLDSGHLMAVKEIRLQDPQLIPTIVAQIRDEMGVLQVLDHPNIVSYYGIEPHRDKVYIFMEYCSGGSLAGLLEHGRIEDETVIQVYALQMLEGLGYLHESGVVHRDIKPENILLDHNGVIKFVDFGAAKVIARQGKTLAAEHAATRQGRQKSMTGTPMYMSPEVIKGTAMGRHGAVDIWSLGCVILEMATGRRPWASLDNEWAIMYNIAQGNPPQLPTHEQLSDQGIAFLHCCFERDPSKRASAAELLQHEWIMSLRAQLSLEPSTPSSEAGMSTLSSMSGSRGASRQNSELTAVEGE